MRWLMSKNRIEPNYEHSLLNIVHSILHHYGLKTDYASIPMLMSELNTDPQNVVLLVFDGMGTDMLQKNLSSDSWLNVYSRDAITSVYPCTTTAAMTTYYSGLSPLEHGWLGWSLYFKEYARTIDTFLNMDSYTKEVVGNIDSARTLMPFETVFDKILKASNQEVSTYTVMPEGIVVAKAPTQVIGADSIEDMGQKIHTVLKNNGNKYIMGYWYEPDRLMHIDGCYADSVKDIITDINHMVEKLATQSEDTLFIVSADHGLCNIDESIYLEEQKDLCDLMLMPPSIEPRCASFFIKPDKTSEFETLFNQRYGDDFDLYTKEAFLQTGYLGKGIAHPKVDDFLGNYIAVGTGRKLLRYRTMNLTVDHQYLGHHAGQTPEEMMVPLILYRS